MSTEAKNSKEGKGLVATLRVLGNSKPSSIAIESLHSS